MSLKYRKKKMASSSTRCPAVPRLILLVGLLTLVLDHHTAGARDFDVNLKGDGCDSLYHIGDDDEATIIHRNTFNTIATRDDCFVQLKTDPGRRLEYSVDKARFHECGIQIFVYDSVTGTPTDPKSVVDCNSRPPVRGKTNFHVLRLHVRKLNVATDNFEFIMRVINDRGKDIGTRGDDAKNVETDPLEPGIIVGIAIAGVIIIIALVLLAIYLCIRARKDFKDNNSQAHNAESSVYTSGNSAHLFANKKYPKRYGSTEDVRSTTSSQEKTNGAYSNSAYSTDAYEKKSDRANSVGRARGKTGFANESYQDDMDVMHGDRHWEDGDDYEVRIGSFRKSRKDSFQERKHPKSAMKKREPPSDIEMSKVNTQPINSILKKSRTKSPNRSQTSSTEGSVDVNAMVYGYNRSTTDHPNVKHKPVLERRRSRSGTRSNRSGSSGGYSGHRRSHSADKKVAKPNSRMYGDVFIDDRDHRSRNNSRSRARSNSLGRRKDRGSESVDSESSTTSSRRVNMNPGGKRVHIKGEETDI